MRLGNKQSVTTQKRKARLSATATANAKAGDRSTPKHITSETVIGSVSSDLVSSYFAPKIRTIAKSVLETYAGDWLEYEEQLKEFESSQAAAVDATAETEIGEDGTVVKNVTRPPPPFDPPHQPLFHSKFIIDELSIMFSEVSDHFFAKTGGWRVTANAARFERMLDERYGIFRPFVTKYPGVELFIRSVQRKYAMGYFSPFRQGNPPIPRSTAIVILFLMQRGGMRWEITALFVLFFLVGLQPWVLVSAVVIVQYLFHRRKSRPPPGSAMKSFIPAVEPYYASPSSDQEDEKEEELTQKKYEYLNHPVGEPFPPAADEIDISQFDTLVLGYGAPCLYTAALLSRAGRKVLVLSSREDASGCMTLDYCKDETVTKLFQNVPFDVEASNVARLSLQQNMLAPALSTTTDLQGGIRFAQIGSELDGHAFEILSIPGVGCEDVHHEIPFILKAAGGPRSIMEEAAMCLGDGFPSLDGDVGDSTAGAYMMACETMNASACQYYQTKILSDSANNLMSSSTYQDAGIRYASSFLNKCFPLNTHSRSLMAGIGMRGENIRPGACSMGAHVTNICAAITGEGMHYPIGGPRALCLAFANVIQKSGGRILTNVQMKELLFDDESPPGLRTTKPEEGPPPPRCVGVKLEDGREIRFPTNRQSKSAIVSTEGFIDTFVRLFPDDIRTKYKVPRGLPALSERRPVFKVLFALEGSVNDLDITGADYYRLPNASIAKDDINLAAGLFNFGEIGGSDDTHDSTAAGEGDGTTDATKDIAESTNADGSSEQVELPGTGGAARPKKSRKRCKFNTGLSWLNISFPSAKDPSFEARHGKVTTCVVTIEADDDFVAFFDTKPKLFSIIKPTAATKGDLERLLIRVEKDLLNIYPQLEGHIRHKEVRGPYRCGLSHTPERYAAKGVRADTPYPGLFVGGSDLTVGDSFYAATVAGWLAANAVIGYDAVDYFFLGKNVTTDLAQFLELPDVQESEDLAVPLKSPNCDDQKSKDD